MRMPSIITVSGPMGSGKSSYLIDFIEEVQCRYVYTPILDSDTCNDHISKMQTSNIHSRDGRRRITKGVTTIRDILNDVTANNLRDTIVVVDEVQFLEDYKEVVNLVKYCKNNQITLVFGGLDLTSECELFLTTSMCMSMSDIVVKLRGVCATCEGESLVSKFIGDEHQASQHTTNNTSKTTKIKVGQELYIGTCLNCH